MKNLKKLLAMLMALAMIVGVFAGCAKNDGTNTPANDKPVADAADNADAANDAAEPAAEAAGTYYFGGIGPLTGDAAIYGTAAMNGAQIAVDEINALGGVQIAFKAEDDVADGETSVNAYNNLLDWGMQVLVGPVTTGAAISVSAVLGEDRVFGLTPSASSADVTAGKDNMYQLCFTDPNQGTGAADYISANMPDKTIAVIYRNDDAYSQGIRDTFVAESANVGLNVVYEGTFTDDTDTDFSVQLTAAQSAGADLVFLPIYYQPASVILKQAADMDYAPTFFGVDGMDGILAQDGFDTSLAEGVMLLTPFSADADNEMTRNFVSTYESLYGETPNQFAADGYDVVYVLYNALETAGCTPDMTAQEICEALVAAMPTITYTGLTGEDMTWSSNGEVSKMPAAVVIENGVYVTP